MSFSQVPANAEEFQIRLLSIFKTLCAVMLNSVLKKK